MKLLARCVCLALALLPICSGIGKRPCPDGLMSAVARVALLQLQFERVCLWAPLSAAWQLNATAH